MRNYLDMESEVVEMKRTQTEVAKKFSISRPFLNQVLGGRKRFSWGRAKKLAAALDVCPAAVMDASPAELRKLFKLEDSANGEA